MKLPIIQGTIARRILVNYRADPAVLAPLLPAPFRPKLVNGHAVAGICLIGLRQIRPTFAPAFLGVSSENAAHRIAVEWDDGGQKREGVYIPRRDTNSRLNALVGGRLFPGLHRHAHFNVQDTPDHVRVAFQSDDHSAHLSVSARPAKSLQSNLFPSLTDASNFFRAGSLGYSATHAPNAFDGIELQCQSWNMLALEVESVTSSFFDDPTRFPEGSLDFDCALIMRQIEHQWHGRGQLCCSPTSHH